MCYAGAQWRSSERTRGRTRDGRRSGARKLSVHWVSRDGRSVAGWAVGGFAVAGSVLILRPKVLLSALVLSAVLGGCVPSSTPAPMMNGNKPNETLLPTPDNCNMT